MKKAIALAMAVMMVIAMAGCGGGETPGSSESAANGGETLQLRLAHEESEGEYQHLFATKFKELVEERSEGRVLIDVYPVGQLGDSTNQVELLQTGAVELAINNPGASATIIPEANIFSLHFFMPSEKEKINTILHEGEGIQYLNELYESQNMHPINWTPQGYMIWTANKPLRTPDDFKGFKIRTMAAPVISKSYEAYGATPVAIPYMELYSALQLKMADGQVNPINNTEIMKFYEVQNYLTLSYQDCFVSTLCANKDFWTGLDDETKKIMEEAVLETNDYMFDVQNKGEEASLQIMRDYGMEIIDLTDEERNAFKTIAENSRNIYTDLVGPTGQELLDLFQKDIDALQ